MRMPAAFSAAFSAGLAALVFAPIAVIGAAQAQDVRTYNLPQGAYPHDVAVSADGTAWYTEQRGGALGRLDPRSGAVELIPLGRRAAPHGVIIGPDGAPWITEGGNNAIQRVDPVTREVRTWALPEARGYVNLNTAAFDGRGNLWFTGQNGVYGRLNPQSGAMQVWDAPRGRGAYGITRTPDGGIWFVSLASNYLARVDIDSGAATVIDPPAGVSGTRRVWSDSQGRLWVSMWNSGHLAVYDPRSQQWQAWKMPGDRPQAYAVYVDEQDQVWVSNWGSNAVLRFNPRTEQFASFPSDHAGSNVRQMLGREGEAWAAESGAGRLRRITYGRATN
jgi:virginiamycin B lyase